MYTIDFVSAVIGYVLGVALCYNTMLLVYKLEQEDNDE